MENEEKFKKKPFTIVICLMHKLMSWLCGCCFFFAVIFFVIVVNFY